MGFDSLLAPQGAGEAKGELWWRPPSKPAPSSLSPTPTPTPPPPSASDGSPGCHCIMITMEVSPAPPITLFYGAITQPEKSYEIFSLQNLENLGPQIAAAGFVSYGCSQVNFQKHICEFWSRTGSSVADLKSAIGPLILSKIVLPLPPSPSSHHGMKSQNLVVLPSDRTDSSYCQLFSLSGFMSGRQLKSGEGGSVLYC